MAQTTYNYTKSPVAADRLTKEIEDSTIVTVLDAITVSDTNLDITFRDALSGADETTLDTIVANHDGTHLPPEANPVRLTEPAETKAQCEVESDFRPNSSRNITQSVANLKLDSDWNLITRSAVFCDEGSFRTDFNSVILENLTGTVTFTANSSIVTGVGTAFLSELQLGLYLKLSTDSRVYLTQINRLISNTQVELVEGYLGSSGSGTGQSAITFHDYNGTGANVDVVDSTLTLNAGTSSDGYAYFERQIDYCPLTLYGDLKIPVRQNNQEIIFGLTNNSLNPTTQAVIVFNGTSETSLIFRTGTSGNIQETTVLLSGFKTSSFLDYEINVLPNKCTLVVEGKIRATHTDSIPLPYEVLNAVCVIKNSGVVASNDVQLHVLYIANVNVLQISNNFVGDPLRVQVVQSPDTRAKGFIDGYIETATVNKFVVRSTDYNEQTTNAQRSIVSTSTNDSSSGTGARSVRLTYYNQDCSGPFYETVTLNGTTPVNTVATDICYIENMEIKTVGSNGTSLGTISLYTTTGGNGTVIGTIEMGYLKTFWCHHYVPNGVSCNITSLICSTSGRTPSSGARFWLAAQNLLTANSVNAQISDTIRVSGSSNSLPRGYGTPIIVQGPARITGNVFTESNAVYESFLSFDYFEE